MSKQPMGGVKKRVNKCCPTAGEIILYLDAAFTSITSATELVTALETYKDTMLPLQRNDIVQNLVKIKSLRSSLAHLRIDFQMWSDDYAT